MGKPLGKPLGKPPGKPLGKPWASPPLFWASPPGAYKKIIENIVLWPSRNPTKCFLL